MKIRRYSTPLTGVKSKKEFLKILDLVRVYVASHISGAI